MSAKLHMPKNMSAKKKKLIRSVLKMWKDTETNSWTKRDKFRKKLKKLGWCGFNDYGAYKVALHKDNIVVKFAGDPKYLEAKCETEREYEQWISAPKQVKKYLTPTYAFCDGLLIQEKVYRTCKDSYDGCDAVEKVYNKVGGELHDYGHNHGHSRHGVVKFFDWVWRRTSFYISDYEMSNRLARR